VKEKLGGVGILSGWGLTEVPVLTMGGPGDPDAKLASTEGRPLPGVDLHVVRADGIDAAPGEVGEIRVKAPQMMLGYVDPSLDNEAFDAMGYFRTGDLGSIDPEGFVTISGRLKDVVIRNGENVGAAEVEELLRLHPAVIDAAVIGLPDSRTGERVCAVVEVRAGYRGLNLDSVGAFLKSHGLRPQAWPSQLEVVPSLPRSVAGKVEKFTLQSKYRAAPGEYRSEANGPTHEGDLT
jgi:cyclohexanecarboxylate-CoA ligase